MFGDKLNMLMHLDAPSEAYTVEIASDGDVVVYFKDKESGIRGRLVFTNDCDMEFIYHVLTRLGFKEGVYGE